MISTKTIYILPLYERKGGRERRTEGKRGGKMREKKKDRQEKYSFFPPFAKRRETEVSANNAINSVSL